MTVLPLKKPPLTAAVAPVRAAVRERGRRGAPRAGAAAMRGMAPPGSTTRAAQKRAREPVPP